MMRQFILTAVHTDAAVPYCIPPGCTSQGLASTMIHQFDITDIITDAAVQQCPPQGCSS
jgi:hypothetical protein